MEPVYTPVIAAARVLFAAQGLKFTISGEHHIPTSGGAVVVMNHLSYMDFAYAGLTALASKRLIRFMCKDSVFHHRLGGPLMRGMKHIPVDRENGGASFRAALKALKAGELVGIFPEATISRSYELKEFKTGAIRMAQAARVPIIPVTLWGSQRVWTKGHPRRFGRTNIPITLTVGEPLEVDRRAAPDDVLTELRSRMQSMLDAAQADYPVLHGDELAYVPARLGGTAPTLQEASDLDRRDALERSRRRAASRSGPATTPSPSPSPSPSDPEPAASASHVIRDTDGVTPDPQDPVASP